MIIKDNIKTYNFYVLGLDQFGLPHGKKIATTSYICKNEFNIVLSQESQVVINIINCPSYLSFMSALGNKFESFSFKEKFVLMPIKGFILCILKRCNDG